MTEVRYTGNAAWTRSILDDKGVFHHTENVLPGEIVDLPEKVAKGLVKSYLPPEQRNFEFVAKVEEEEKKEAPAPSRPAVHSRPSDKK